MRFTIALDPSADSWSCSIAGIDAGPREEPGSMFDEGPVFVWDEGLFLLGSAP